MKAFIRRLISFLFIFCLLTSQIPAVTVSTARVTDRENLVSLMPPHPDIAKKVQEQTEPERSTILSLRQSGLDRATVQKIMPQGTFRAILLLVDFSDKNSQVTASYFDSLVFGTSSPSVRHYWKEVSYGVLDIVTVNLPSSTGWFRAPQTYSYYTWGQGGLGSYPHNAQKLVEDAITLADPYVDFSQYDNNADGYVDALMVVHAGTGREALDDSSQINSHKWATSTPVTVDGVRASEYTIMPEHWPADWKPLPNMTIGVFCHELGHVFGLPDLYDIDQSSEGAGEWCLMASGSWNGLYNSRDIGSSPAHPCAWARTKLGWGNVVNVTGELLSARFDGVESGGNIYHLTLGSAPGMSDEYFLVEKRQNTGYDFYLPYAGLLIWHIDESMPGNDWECLDQYNWTHPSQHYKVALEQADGRLDLEYGTNRGNHGDPYPPHPYWGDIRNFTLATTPNSGTYRFYDSNPEVRVENISNWPTTADLKVVVGAPPVITTSAAINARSNSVTFNGSLDRLGTAPTVNVSFQWDTSPGSYSNETEAQAMTAPGPVSFGLDGLSADTTYYFRAKAVGYITTYGADMLFNTWTSPPMGKLAFYSRRNGNSQIYTMYARGSTQTRITNNTLYDYTPAWSSDGTKIAFQRWLTLVGNLLSDPEIHTMNADGSNQTRLTFKDYWCSNPVWSPDGTKIAFDYEESDDKTRIWVMNADGTNQARLTSEVGRSPAWSPDGTKIAFTSTRDGNSEIYVMNTDGTVQTRLTNNPANETNPSWSPDGTKIVFTSGRDGNGEIYVMNVDGTNQRNLTNNTAHDNDPAWSRDGTRIAFASERYGDWEIYVMDADGNNQARLTLSPGEDGHPSWLIISPAVSTSDATEVAGTSATLHMAYNFNDYASGSVQFAYKPSEGDWTYTPWMDKSDIGTYEESITSLTSGVNYNFKARLKYETTEIEGGEKSFTILSMPTVTNVSGATDITSIAATLNGKIITDGGEPCQYRFQYDTITGPSYAYSTTWRTDLKTTGQSFSDSIAGLNPGTKYYFIAQAKNSAGTSSGTEASFTTNTTPLDITTTALPGATLGVPYSQALEARGGTTPYTWSISSGSLPAGLSLAPSTGVISGTPSAEGAISFTVQVTDSAPTPATDTQALSITVALPVSNLIGAGDVSSSTNFTPNYIALTKWTATASGNLNQVRVKCGAPGNVKVAVYADSAGSPGALLAANNTGQAVTPDWNTINLPSSASITEGTAYWIALNSDAACTGYVTGSETMAYKQATYSGFSFPNPAGTGFTNGAYYSIAQGWGTPPPIPLATTFITPGTTLTFKWGAVDRATNYHLQVNTLSGFNGTDIFNAEVGNVTLKEVTGLTPGTTYYWHVKAGNAAGWSGWSPVRSVTTNTVP